MLHSHRPCVTWSTGRISKSKGSSTTCVCCNAYRQSRSGVQSSCALQQYCQQVPRQWSELARPLLQAAAVVAVQLHLATAGHAAELVEINVNNEGNIPSELSAAGEAAPPKLSSLVSGANKKPIEGCTRKCVPTCIRGGEGSPGLGPISVRKEIIVFKDGFRSRQYCLSECAQVCSVIINKESSSSSSSSSDGGGSSSVQASSTSTSTSSSLE